MRYAIVFAFVVILVGCAEDNYSVVPNGPGSPDRMSADLKACKAQALDAFFDAQKSNTHTGAVVGAVLGGALGGAIGGSIDAESGKPAMTDRDIDPAIEKCMLSKGYVGTSRN